jgi:hypothetical protein
MKNKNNAAGACEDYRRTVVCRHMLYALVLAWFLMWLAGCARIGGEQLPQPPPEVYDWCEANSAEPGCARLLAARAEDLKVAGWMERFQPWAAGFLALATIGGLTWYLVAFSRMAFVGTRFCDVAGGYSRAMAIIAKIDRENADLLAGGLSAAAFGAHKDPKP